MDKKLKSIIDKVSKRYGVELIDVDKEEEAGIFVDIDGKEVNISELSENEIFDKVFCLDNYNLNYSSLVISDENNNKNILNINNTNKCSHFYNENGKVA